MRKVTITTARRRLGALLDEVAAGEEIILVRKSRPIARLTPILNDERWLPSLEDFRRSIDVHGPTLGEELAAARKDERY